MEKKLKGSTNEKYTRGAGRIAQAIDLTTGKAKGDPCWLYTNKYTNEHLRYNETAFGQARTCDEALVLNRILEYPAEVPAWSAVLYNQKVYSGAMFAADPSSTPQMVHTTCRKSRMLFTIP